MSTFLRTKAIAAFLFAIASQSHATVVDSPHLTISGNEFRTFVDTATGETWLDLDNFFQ